MIFGNHDTKTDFGLTLTFQKIETPALKTYDVDLPAGDGKIDLSEFFGGVKLKNRKLEFEFTHEGADSPTLIQTISNALHGLKLAITTDDDPDWYYIGRVSVSEGARISKTVGKILMTCDCDPYKYKLYPTIIPGTIGVTGTLTRQCPNSRKKVIPEITVSGAVYVTFGTGTYALVAGTHKITNIVFAEGFNPLTVAGAEGVTVAVEYQEGAI